MAWRALVRARNHLWRPCFILCGGRRRAGGERTLRFLYHPAAALNSAPAQRRAVRPAKRIVGNTAIKIVLFFIACAQGRKGATEGIFSGYCVSHIMGATPHIAHNAWRQNILLSLSLRGGSARQSKYLGVLALLFCFPRQTAATAAGCMCRLSSRGTFCASEAPLAVTLAPLLSTTACWLSSSERKGWDRHGGATCGGAPA